jgi:ubiquinone/menaquinone biosynthesis C-methylase UbiE
MSNTSRDLADTTRESVFDVQIEQYDSWFDSVRGAAIFAEELRTIQPFTASLPRPWLEIGVGTGRFGAALGVQFGIDPAQSALALAKKRGISVARACGEALPFRSGGMGSAFIIATLCFVDDALKVLQEAARVVCHEGGIVLGLIPAHGSWGRYYHARGVEGDPYYRDAHFFTVSEVSSLLEMAGLEVTRWRSSLLWSPQDTPPEETSIREGLDRSAGFVAALASCRQP